MDLRNVERADTAITTQTTVAKTGAGAGSGDSDSDLGDLIRHTLQQAGLAETSSTFGPEWQVSVLSGHNQPMSADQNPLGCNHPAGVPIVLIHPSNAGARPTAATAPISHYSNEEKSTALHAATVTYGGLCVSKVERRAWCETQEMKLTPKEFELLWLFINQPKRVYSRYELIDTVWGRYFEGYDHTVSNHINRLRKKLSAMQCCKARIETVWGVGYKLEQLS
ncbi:winged helix-turn-helix domain-containing protein [Halioxenophilus aromaticivorans]|uniref:OmpR/PhoB-type domain-containing protein n=1 Tax=Halioxenophilus aromaticivorans TaxID=1306992 RepID=A0AAV3U9H9_9ALTE